MLVFQYLQDLQAFQDKQKCWLFRRAWHHRQVRSSSFRVSSCRVCRLFRTSRDVGSSGETGTIGKLGAPVQLQETNNQNSRLFSHVKLVQFQEIINQEKIPGALGPSESWDKWKIRAHQAPRTTWIY